MKILKTFSLSILLASSTLTAVSVQAAGNAVIFTEAPAKTVFFKSPMASDVNKFFSTGTTFKFEVYKVGSKEEVANIVAAFKSDPAVENVYPGVVTGDYQAFTILLKSAQSKEWFVAQFKKAGLNNIKINNNPVTEMDKL